MMGSRLMRWVRAPTRLHRTRIERDDGSVQVVDGGRGLEGQEREAKGSDADTMESKKKETEERQTDSSLTGTVSCEPPNIQKPRPRCTPRHAVGCRATGEGSEREQ